MTVRTDGFKARLRRLFATNQELADEALARQSAADGAEQLNKCKMRCRVVVRGEISSITLDKQGGWLEAEVTDGTGSVTVVWMGRREIPGVGAGRCIRVSGRLTSRGDHMVMYNPEYELLGQG